MLSPRGMQNGPSSSPRNTDFRKVTEATLDIKVKMTVRFLGPFKFTPTSEMIDNPEVDVIYNPLPNGLHFEWTMKALIGGKHVLLEKPATNTAAEAAQIYYLAASKNLVVLEAFHYRSVTNCLQWYIYAGKLAS
jgi:hypothetical protein